MSTQTLYLKKSRSGPIGMLFETTQPWFSTLIAFPARATNGRRTTRRLVLLEDARLAVMIVGGAGRRPRLLTLHATLPDGPTFRFADCASDEVRAWPAGTVFVVTACYPRRLVRRRAEPSVVLGVERLGDEARRGQQLMAKNRTEGTEGINAFLAPRLET